MSKRGKRLLWVAAIPAGALAAAALTVYIVIARYDYNSLKPRIEQAALEATGRELVLGGDMDLKVGLRPYLVLRDVRFANAAWGSAPYMVTIERFELQVALIPLLSGDVQVNRLLAVRPDILVETGPGGRTNLTVEPAKRAEETRPATSDKEEMRLPALTVYDLHIQDGALTYRNGATGGSYSLALQRLQAASASGLSPLDLELNGTAGRMDFRISGSLGSIQSLTDPEKDWAVDLAVEAAGGRVDIKGHIKDPMTFRGLALTLAGRVEAPDKLNHVLARELPIKTPFTIKTALSDPSERIYSFDNLEIVHGRSDLTGSSILGMAGPRPHVFLDLHSKAMDLTWLTRGSGVQHTRTQPEKAGTSVPERDKAFSDNRFSVKGLQSLDADVSLQAGEVILPGSFLTDVRIEAELKNGLLVVQPFQAEVAEGLVQGWGRAEVLQAGLKTALSLQADNLDLASLTGKLEGGDRFSGRLRADVELQGQGGSIAAVMAGLGGKVKLAVSNGALDDRYLNLLGSDLRSGVFRLLNPVKDKSEKVKVNCLIAMIVAENGLADIAVLVFDTPTMTVRGAGNINLQTEALNVNLDPRPKEGLDTRVAGRLSLSLGELTRSFKLGGTLARPKLALDRSQTVTTIAKGLGGVLLFGPAGLAAALAAGAEEDADPCLSALELLEDRKASPSSDKPSIRESEPKPGTVEKGGKAVKDAVKGVQDSLKRLFGN